MGNSGADAASGDGASGGGAGTDVDVEGEAGLAPSEDLMTFARGAIPLKVTGAGAGQGAKIEEAIESIDGNPTPFTLLTKGNAASSTELVYLLPAETAFDGFASPNVGEVPSKFTTFIQGVEVHGSATGPDSGYTLLARSTLTTHSKPGQQTELDVVAKKPAKWIKLRLAGGISIESDKMSFQFSELIGRGTQAQPSLSQAFKGSWGKGNHGFELKQSGAAVSGCYDGAAPLDGTVSGNILRARGEEPRTKCRRDRAQSESSRRSPLRVMSRTRPARKLRLHVSRRLCLRWFGERQDARRSECYGSSLTAGGERWHSASML